MKQSVPYILAKSFRLHGLTTALIQNQKVPKKIEHDRELRFFGYAEIKSPAST